MSLSKRVMSSCLLNYYFQWLNPEKGEALAEVKKEHVEKLAIKQASPKQREGIVRLVNRVLDAKENDSNTDTSAVERPIDQMVYKLYGLTEEEIKVVENPAK